MSFTRRSFIGLAAALVASGCVDGGSFRTYYDQPISPGVSRGWRVTDVRVTVPKALTVSEAKTFLPAADIVWREDPPGDRHAQVAAIVRTAALRGVSGLEGPRPVVLNITVLRFHALTFEAERRLSRSGVHNIDFIAQVTDAVTGTVLAGPVEIEASLPALSGADMRAARARGETQKSQISANVARAVAGWLGAGPDARTSFTRAGN